MRSGSADEVAAIKREGLERAELSLELWDEQADAYDNPTRPADRDLLPSRHFHARCQHFCNSGGCRFFAGLSDVCENCLLTEKDDGDHRYQPLRKAVRQQ